MKNECNKLKSIICTLDYIGVNLFDNDVIKFIREFLNSEKQGRTEFFKNHKNISSNGIKIIDDGKINFKLLMTYEMFRNNDIDVDYYYTCLSALKESVISIITDDILIIGNIYSSVKYDLYKSIVVEAIKFNLQNPTKFKSKKYITVNADLIKLIKEDNHIFDIRINKDNSYEVNFKESIINTLNSHMSSLKRVPKHFYKRLSDIKHVSESLRKNFIDEKCVFIIDRSYTKININGRIYEKEENIDNNKNIYVTDSYITLNVLDRTHYLIDKEHKLYRYIKETGIFHHEGHIFAE